LIFSDSSNPNHSRVVGGRVMKPYEGRRSTNLPDGWRVELPQKRGGGINDKRNK